MKHPFRPQDGQTVQCPADRGQPAYSGIVESSGSEVHHNHAGQPFVWATVRNPHGHTSVWPTNRLA